MCPLSYQPGRARQLLRAVSPGSCLCWSLPLSRPLPVLRFKMSGKCTATERMKGGRGNRPSAHYFQNSLSERGEARLKLGFQRHLPGRVRSHATQAAFRCPLGYSQELGWKQSSGAPTAAVGWDARMQGATAPAPCSPQLERESLFPFYPPLCSQHSPDGKALARVQAEAALLSLTSGEVSNGPGRVSGPGEALCMYRTDPLARCTFPRDERPPRLHSQKICSFSLPAASGNPLTVNIRRLDASAGI